MPLHVHTPVFRSTVWSNQRGQDVWLKLDAVQPTGSFKIRGLGHAAERAVERGAKRLLSSSGGNAGLAAAYAARQLGVPITIVVPQRTGALMRERIAAEGAQVVVHGEVWDDAHQHAIGLSSDEAVLLHPFDDPDVWAGNASLVHELVSDLPCKPGTILVAVGGGGLLLGVLQGLREVGWDDVDVVTVETHGAASLKGALDAEALITLPGIDSIALTLGAKTVAEQAWRQSAAWPVRALSVSDAAAVEALQALLQEHRLLVEPACGAALAPLFDSTELRGPIVAIVCGGASATPEALDDWRRSVGPTV